MLLLWVRIVDAETGRGVPLVELRTPNAVPFWTDSNGVAVIDDPAFQDHDIAFSIHSDGHEFPGKLMIGEDSGQVLHVQPDAHDELKVRRLNIAERLFYNQMMYRLRLDDHALRTLSANR